MKRLFTILLALFVVFSAAAQSEKSIILDQNTFRPIQSDALTGVAIDKIGVDSSRRPCARVKVKINRMSKDDINKIEVKIHSNNELTKCKTAEYDNGLIIEMTAKSATRFYFYHPEFGYSNEVTLNLEANKEYYIEASLNKTYSIVINSNVPDAEVYLDGKFMSRTDVGNSCIIKDVLIGEHDLKLVYGNLTYKKKIEVNSSSISFTQNVDTEATESQFVVFIVEPSNAIVMINNQPYALQDGAMQEVLAAGTYNYTVTAAGYHSQSGTFSVAGEKVEKHITLTADSTFVTLSAPDNAEIWINGTKRGNGTWRGMLNSGNYIFEARKDGHKSGKISQYIASGNAHQSFTLPSPTPIYGSLVVSGTPIAAEVKLDGKTIGTMPIKQDKLLIGSHTLTISKSGYQTETCAITIAEGKTTTENVALKKDETQSYNQTQTELISLDSQTLATYNIGDLVTINDVQGVVFQTTPVVKIVSAAEGVLKWSAEYRSVDATDENDGQINLLKIKEVSEWEQKYPAFKWCTDLGEGWFLPSIDELEEIYNHKKEINETLEANNLCALASNYSWLWSSSEIDDTRANYMFFTSAYKGSDFKGSKCAVRAVLVLDSNGSVNIPVVSIPKSTPATYNIGDLVTINGVQGVVFQTSPVVKIVSVKEQGGIQWSTEKIATNVKGYTSGEDNASKIESISNWQYKYPAFKWCADLGAGWYLPTQNELGVIYVNKDKINQILMANRMDLLGAKGSYRGLWSSCECNSYSAAATLFSSGNTYCYSKYEKLAVRAVLVLD